MYPGGASCTSAFLDWRRSFLAAEPPAVAEEDPVDPVSALSLSEGSFRTHSRKKNQIKHMDRQAGRQALLIFDRLTDGVDGDLYGL